jgi:hypothetical protein
VGGEGQAIERQRVVSGDLQAVGVACNGYDGHRAGRLRLGPRERVLGSRGGRDGLVMGVR